MFCVVTVVGIGGDDGVLWYPCWLLLLVGGLGVEFPYFLHAFVLWLDDLQWLQYTPVDLHVVQKCPCSPHL